LIAILDATPIAAIADLGLQGAWPGASSNTTHDQDVKRDREAPTNTITVFV